MDAEFRVSLVNKPEKIGVVVKVQVRVYAALYQELGYAELFIEGADPFDDLFLCEYV